MRSNNRVYSTSGRNATLDPPKTHEGAPAKTLTPEQQLRRSVMANMLFEDTFYEDGKSIADRIETLIAQVPADKVAAIAVEARQKMFLRHVPLAIVNGMTKASTEHQLLVGDVLPLVVQRADELAEFLAIYFNGQGDRRKNSKDKPGHALSAQVKKGLARAFSKFDAYQLAKYNQDHAVKLRDVMFLTHPKPQERFTEEIAKQLASNTLPTPDTWEVNLSATKGENKKDTWEKQIPSMGTMALIRNLRNFAETGVDHTLVRDALLKAKPDKVLPFRFIAAARYGPTYAPELETLMFKNLEGQPKLVGKTAVLVDVSGSMTSQLSAKSEMQAIDAGAGLAVLARELCDSTEIIAFESTPTLVPSYRGLGLAQAIGRPRGGTDTAAAITMANKRGYDRIIILTDEQSHTRYPDPLPKSRAYVVNIGNYKHGIGYGRWVHIDGWSEQVLTFIRMYETEFL